MNATEGRVYLVGAGPGDPGLLTLRGAVCLRDADVILYDYLACQELLRHAHRDAEIICLGRHGRERVLSQSEINALMIDRAGRGLRVVRLKGGDPVVFGRVAEEIRALEEAGVDYEIVPGVTAALAASSYTGFPLTNRDEASAVALVTGHEQAEKEARSALDYRGLAKFPGTIVFYMGVTTARNWSEALLEGGKPPETPVAIIRRATFPDQETHSTSLGEVADYIAREKLRPPAIIVVGEVARNRNRESWFTARPLFGTTVLVTRPEHQSESLAEPLRLLGAKVLTQPAIEIADPPDWAPVDAAIDRLGEFRWLVFSSANGVHYFLRRLLSRGHDVRRLGGTALGAIGPGTAEALASYHLRADLQPEEYRAEAMAESLAPVAQGAKVLLLRASRGREVLREMLTVQGALVEQCVVYESRDVLRPDSEVAASLDTGEIRWVTVTSSAIARSLVRMFGDSLRGAKLVAISPLTAGVLSELGFPPAATAEIYTTGGVVDAILRAEARP